MKRKTTDSMNAGTQGDVTAGNACWENPPLVFEKLNEDFGPFDIDLTADAKRHLCPLWFGPDSPLANGDDALSATWFWPGAAMQSSQVLGRTACGYSNPPYGPFVQRMLAKAKAEATRGFTSTLLLPMRVTVAFKAHVLKGAAALLFCDSRIVFFENGAPRLNEKRWREEGKLVPDPAMFDSILVRYEPGTPADERPRVDTWEVPVHVTKADLERARQLMVERQAA